MIAGNSYEFGRWLTGAALICLVQIHATAHVDSSQFSTTDSGTFSTPALTYVSDYISFVGQDARGHVAFALDNNRGRDGETYQAEHFFVFHDEHDGWIDLVGNGRYDNAKKDLFTIPDSPFFRFTGSPHTGLTFVSEKNQLTLRVAPLVKRTENTHSGAIIWMSSGSATLTWQGRSIPGRVIYEYLQMPDFNRLTHTYWGMWKEFQGFYLAAGAKTDIYAHSQFSERITPLIGSVAGFAAIDGETDAMTDLNVATLNRELALGFYRWPKSWRITWIGSQRFSRADAQPIGPTGSRELGDRRIFNERCARGT